MGEIEFGETLLLYLSNIILSEINQLGVLQLCEHLIFDFLQLIARQVDCSNTRHGAKGAASNLDDLIVAEKQPSM